MKIFTALLIIWSITGMTTGRLLPPKVTPTSDDDIDIRLSPSAANPTNRLIFERIVVFIYKDIFGNVKLYIPNGNKQASIQELSQDSNDLLVNLPSQKVKDIFRNNNPYATWTIGKHSLVKPQINAKYYAAEIENLLTDNGLCGLCDDSNNKNQPDVDNEPKNNEEVNNTTVLPDIPEKNKKDDQNEPDAKLNEQSEDDNIHKPGEENETDNNSDNDPIVIPKIPVDDLKKPEDEKKPDDSKPDNDDNGNSQVLPETIVKHDQKPDEDDENSKDVLPEIPAAHRESNDGNKIVFPDDPSKDRNETDSQLDENDKLDYSDRTTVLPEISPEHDKRPPKVDNPEDGRIIVPKTQTTVLPEIPPEHRQKPDEVDEHNKVLPEISPEHDKRPHEDDNPENGRIIVPETQITVLPEIPPEHTQKPDEDEGHGIEDRSDPNSLLDEDEKPDNSKKTTVLPEIPLEHTQKPDEVDEHNKVLPEISPEHDKRPHEDDNPENGRIIVPETQITVLPEIPPEHTQKPDEDDEHNKVLPEISPEHDKRPHEDDNPENGRIIVPETQITVLPEIPPEHTQKPDEDDEHNKVLPEILPEHDKRPHEDDKPENGRIIVPEIQITVLPEIPPEHTQKPDEDDEHNKEVLLEIPTEPDNWSHEVDKPANEVEIIFLPEIPIDHRESNDGNKIVFPDDPSKDRNKPGSQLDENDKLDNSDKTTVLPEILPENDKRPHEDDNPENGRIFVPETQITVLPEIPLKHTQKPHEVDEHNKVLPEISPEHDKRPHEDDNPENGRIIVPEIQITVLPEIPPEHTQKPDEDEGHGIEDRSDPNSLLDEDEKPDISKKTTVLPEIPLEHTQKPDEVDEHNKVLPEISPEHDKRPHEDDNPENGRIIVPKIQITVLPEIPPEHTQKPDEDDEHSKEVLPEIPTEPDNWSHEVDKPVNEVEIIVLPEIPMDHRESNDGNKIVFPDDPSKDRKKPGSQLDENDKLDNSDRTTVLPEISPEHDKRPHEDDDPENGRIIVPETQITVLPEIPLEHTQKPHEVDEHNKVLPEISPEHDKRPHEDDNPDNGRIIVPETQITVLPAIPLEHTQKPDEDDEHSKEVLPEIPTELDNWSHEVDKPVNEVEIIVLPEIPIDHRESNDGNKIVFPDDPSKDRNKPGSQLDENDKLGNMDKTIVLPEILPENDKRPHEDDNPENGRIIVPETQITVLPAIPLEHTQKPDEDEGHGLEERSDPNSLLDEDEKPDISKKTTVLPEIPLEHTQKPDEVDEHNKVLPEISPEHDKRPYEDDNPENGRIIVPEIQITVLPEIPPEHTQKPEEDDEHSKEVLPEIPTKPDNSSHKDDKDEDVRIFVPEIPETKPSDLNPVNNVNNDSRIIIIRPIEQDTNNVKRDPKQEDSERHKPDEKKEGDNHDEQNQKSPQILHPVNNQVLNINDFIKLLKLKENKTDKHNLPEIHKNENNNGKGNVIILEPVKDINESDGNSYELLVVDPIPDSNNNNENNKKTFEIEGSENKPIILHPIDKSDENGNFNLSEIKHKKPPNSAESKKTAIVLPPIPDNDESEVNPSDNKRPSATKPNDVLLNVLPPVTNDAKNEERIRTLHTVSDILFKNLNQNNLKDFNFDDWLESATKTITPVRSKEYIVIRESIIEILNRNNLKVNSDKRLVDSYGRLVDPAEIKLRPVFIGPDGGFSRTKDGIKVEVPKGKSFLEAILVIRSQKVLGTIPLGATPPLEDCDSKDQKENNNDEVGIIERVDSKEIKDKSEKNKISDYVYDDDNNEDSREYIEANIQKVENVGVENVYVKILTPRQAAKFDADPALANTIITLADRNVNYHLLAVEEYDYDKIITVTPVQAKAEPLVIRNPNERNSIKRQRSGVIHNILRQRNIKADPRRRRLVNRVPARLVKYYGDDDEYLSNDEVPDRGVPMKKKVGFASEDYYYNRIIGGNTATGSGIPISNKGRVGLIH